MRLAHFFIDHPRFATVINIFIVLVGLATLTTLPVAQYPNIVPPDRADHDLLSWRVRRDSCPHRDHTA
jgi:hypothetical protein